MQTRAVKRQQLQTVGWTVLSIAVALLILLALSTIDNPDGTPWLESTLVGQSVALVGLVAAAVLPAQFATRKDAAETKDQVQNAHIKPDGTPLNLRDDLDDKFGAVAQRHEDLDTGQKHLIRLVEGLIDDRREDRKEVHRLTERVVHLSGRVSNNSKLIRTVQEQIGPCPDKGEPHA